MKDPIPASRRAAYFVTFFVTLVAGTLLLAPLASAQTPSAQTPSAQTPTAQAPSAQTPTAQAPSAQTFSTDQRREIEGIVKDYLVSHPEVMQEVMDAVEKHQKEADADKARVTIRDNKATLFNSTHQVVLGNPQGNVTMVEFFDYNCGFCKRALPDMLDLLKTDSDLKFVLKEFPVLGEGSIEAARVAVAVRMQDASGKKYVEFHQKLLGARGQADKAHALAAAKEAGFDMARLEKDMTSDEVKKTIDENMKLADALGVSGTPSYVIGDEVLVGAVGFDALKKKIKAERK